MPWQALKDALAKIEGGTFRHLFDWTRESLGLQSDDGTPSAASKVAFTIALVALAAKMSKADGEASSIELKVFEEQFKFPEQERANMLRLFELASRDTAGFETYASQVADLLKDEPELKLVVIECLFHVASADGVLHPAEDDYLHTVALILGLGEEEFLGVRRAFISDPDSPYEVLNVDPTASDEVIKKRYRELVRSHHPDLLIAKGVPPMYLAAAERRLAAITVAYNQIQSIRGKSVKQAVGTSP